MSKPEYKVDIFTGIRPTGNLTVANYLGAVKPIVKLQSQGYRPLVFVADIHALTDNEPSLVKKYTNEVVADYIALGVDPDTTTIYIQSAIANQVSSLTLILSRLISVAELLRVPTLKEKLKSTLQPENANALLLLYPVLMAADILINRAKEIPVGEDQLSHIEVTRELARRFNKNYGEVFSLPKAHQVESLRILSLKGDGKMSKTSPETAIFLTDSPDEVIQKIKKAETAFEGQMSNALKNHIFLAKELSSDENEHKKIDIIIGRHLKGEKVMGEFKDAFSDIVNSFLATFQTNRKKITENPDYIESILEKGNAIARSNADETMAVVNATMYK